MKFLALILALAPQDPEKNKQDQEKRMQERDTGVAPQREIRVYLMDTDRRPIDTQAVTVTILLEPRVGLRQVLRTELVRPGEGKNKDVHVDKRGKIRMMEGGYLREVLFCPGRKVGETYDRKKEGDAPLEDRRDRELRDQEGRPIERRDANMPYFRATANLEGYACGMEGHPVYENAQGNCAACGMALKTVEPHFTATGIAKIKGETRLAKGFVFPLSGRGFYGASVLRIEECLREIRGLVEIPSVSAKIGETARQLPVATGPEDKDAIQRLSSEIVTTVNELDAAAQKNDRAGVDRALTTLQEKPDVLEKLSTNPERNPVK